MRPYYLPREFTSTITIAVYIPPSADAAVACEVISSATAKLQTEHPDAFMVITGDFNHASLWGGVVHQPQGVAVEGARESSASSVLDPGGPDLDAQVADGARARPATTF
ncbi:hypothetical protein N1851_015438 [Merluccius polli]|uniref:Endonuclease/exonuclease/phosphatase domain-containing protein n=1 Tax=Merluccius polli TaxID=89951 RepID=A0AA47P3Q4_MERPO|nr:hypothetical protein N1851_015438 [Merluccius polli]